MIKCYKIGLCHLHIISIIKVPKSNLVAHHIRWIEVMIHNFWDWYIVIGLSDNFQSIESEGAVSNVSKKSYKIQTTSHHYQKLYSTPPWHGARTWKVLRKYRKASLSYIAKMKHEGQTDRHGRFNISRPEPLAQREINIQSVNQRYFYVRNTYLIGQQRKHTTDSTKTNTWCLA